MKIRIQTTPLLLNLPLLTKLFNDSTATESWALELHNIWCFAYLRMLPVLVLFALCGFPYILFQIAASTCSIHMIIHEL